jgi:hypothetical protein
LAADEQRERRRRERWREITVVSLDQNGMLERLAYGGENDDPIGERFA